MADKTHIVAGTKLPYPNAAKYMINVRHIEKQPAPVGVARTVFVNGVNEVSYLPSNSFEKPASGPLVANLAKRSLAAAADESQPTRVDSVTDAGSFDPSQPISCTDTTAEAAELDLPSIFDDSDAKGTKVSEVLALRVNEACTKKALDSKLKEIEAKYKAPENCDFLCVPKVNLEFWFELARQARTKDLALQEAQRGITKGLQPVIELVEKTKSELKPDAFITPLVDAITLLCNASFRFSLVRRETMREFVNPSYRSLCSKNTPPGKWLFGDELPKQIKEIAEVNKMAKKLGPSQTSPGTRRGDRRNTSGRGSSFNQGQGRKVYFLGSRNRSNTTHNRRDNKSNPHSWTATKQHSSQ
ncbi:uncharacterized protein [Montipora capricornis]|uniref:uncharacterized protein n=1 Tax=Montipora capricornis TaxID=246305 RepID=UPI0035F16D75